MWLCKSVYLCCLSSQMAIIEHEATVSPMSFRDGKCFVNETQEWGSPCKKTRRMLILVFMHYSECILKHKHLKQLAPDQCCNPIWWCIIASRQFIVASFQLRHKRSWLKRDSYAFCQPHNMLPCHENIICSSNQLRKYCSSSKLSACYASVTGNVYTN